MLASIGAHLVPIAHPLICKWFLHLKIQLFKARINFKKVIITLADLFLLFNLVSTSLMFSLCGMLITVSKHPLRLKCNFQ